MRPTLVLTTVTALLLAAAPEARACIGVGNASGSSWEEALLIVGVITASCVTSTTTHAALNSSSEQQVEKDAHQKAQEEYLRSNLSLVRREAVAGGGEYLNAYGRLLGCPIHTRDRLAQTLRGRHRDVFSDSSVANTNERVRALVGADPILVAYCLYF